MAKRKRKPESAPEFIHDPLWYKDAVIYQVHVKSYFDANNDGIGDFPGLIAKLDYIADLGVNTIWLLPFYPSPRRDDGYDIAEYCAVHPDYGGMADAKRFIAEAHKRGLRVITELVINHTSDQHPWFKRAREAPKGSKARDYYVWSDTSQKYEGTRIIFLDTEKSNWTWDPVAGQYFWHRFYSHQPDLNFDNPQVLKEVLSVMRFWLNLGVDGLRLDAIPYLIERDGTNNENLPETHQVLKRIRAELDATYPDRMLLAEANQWPEDTRMYFGGKEIGGKGVREPVAMEHVGRDIGAMEVTAQDRVHGDRVHGDRVHGDRVHADQNLGDECHMAFHFPLMPRMYMAIAQEDRFPITDILRQTPDIPSNCQWAIFLRNHDELTLEMVTDQERDYLWNYYAADRRARINLGIRRRLAPLVERDRRRIELLHSLLLSMPGTPTLYYGDEIGMGDNIFLGDRDGVRTPMQWSVDRNGGFSRADTATLVLPPLMDPLYGFQTINVEAQQRDPHSLLNWTRRMLAVRKQQKAFGRGTLKLLSPTNRRVLAYLREYTHEDGTHEGGRHDTILCVANLSRAAQAVELELAQYSGKVPVEMTAGSSFPPIGELNYLLTLAPYGFYWFLLADKTQMPSWHVPAPERLPELMTLVIRRDPIELLQGMNRNALQQEALPAYLQRRRWFAGQNEPPEQTIIEYAVPFGAYNMLCGVAVKRPHSIEHYQLPMGFAREDAPNTPAAQQLALARVRRGAITGFVTDAFTLPDFVRDLVQALRNGHVLKHDSGDIHFLPTPQLATFVAGEGAPPDGEEVRLVAAEQSNSSVRIGEHMVLKLVRRVLPGIHPETEMGGYLTRHGFANTALLLGEVRRVDPEGTPHTLMILQRFLNNQGDAWAWTQNTLARAIRDQLAGGVSLQENQYAAINELKAFAGMLGKRLGEMHLLLAQASEDETDFHAQGTDDADVQHWIDSIGTQVHDALLALEQHRTQLDEAARRQADLLIARRDVIVELVAKLALRTRGGLRIRVHGDLHLGQVLVVQGDACIIDFEGEPARSLEERRARHSPMKDVAGMLRSFDYAAAMAMRNAQGTDSSVEAAQARQQVATVYLQQSQLVFLEAYRHATETLPHAWVESGGEKAALALFCIDKAAYEILYEARYRPDWLSVPVQGLLEFTQHLSGGGAQ